MFFILGYFLPFYLPNSPKNHNLEKVKKSPGYIIILHMCTKNHDHMLHCSWDMVRDGCNYFSFWAIFRPFSPPKALKIEILQKWKNCLEISSFYISVPKIMISWCTVLGIWWTTDLIISHFGILFALLPPLKPKISKFWKNEKNTWRFIILHMLPQTMIRWCTVPEIWCMTHVIVIFHLRSFFALLPP